MLFIHSASRGIPVSMRNGRPRSHNAAVMLLALALLLGSMAACAGDLDDVIAFDIEAQTLDKALLVFGAQAHVQIMFAWNSATGQIKTGEFKGRFTGRQLLTNLLQGTSLVFREHGDTIEIFAERQTDNRGRLGNSRSTPTRGRPQADPEDPPEQGMKPQKPRTKASATLEEVIVTGTRIRGMTHLASPIETFSRDDIDTAGVQTAGQFLQLLPQNFNGGASEGAFFSGGGNSSNTVFATGVNLLGLGNSASLVLLNGHRFAPDSNRGNLADVSMIPVTAIERIDVLTDGASSLYGSDAVAGVVNIILRRTFEGSETRVSYGSVTNGSSREVNVGQSLGHVWSTGQALLSYEFYDRTPLSASDRPFSQNALLPFGLLPEQVRHSLVATVDQAVENSVELYGSANFSHRSVFDDSTYNTGSSQSSYYFTYPASIDLYTGIAGAKIELPRASHLDVSATYSRSDTSIGEYYRIGIRPPAIQFYYRTHTNLTSLDVNLDGAAVSLPGGRVLYAVGGQFRRETLDFHSFVTPSGYAPSRRIVAAYLELHVPILGITKSKVGISNVALDISGRTEHYSDFGQTTNPKIGLTGNLFHLFRLRTTYSKSFQAPLLYDTNPLPTGVFAYSGAVEGGGPNLLEITGGNPALKPETATTWTAGFDFRSSTPTGIRGSATYYDVHFDNEIVIPSQIVDVSHLYSYASELGPQILDLDPSAEQIAALVENPKFVNLYKINLATVGAIFDSRSHNVSALLTRGIDFRTNYVWGAGAWQYDLGVDGTYILAFGNKVTPGAPSVSVLNTPYNPIDLKVRGHAALRVYDISLALFGNYINAYSDNRVLPAVPVSSWTTFDATMTYDVTGVLPGIKRGRITLGILNATNRSPPFLRNISWPVQYDGANGNPLGRFISAQVTLSL